MESVASQPDDLTSFIDFLYEGLEGYVYLAAKNRNLPDDDKKAWQGEFFEYPSHVETIKQVVTNINNQGLDVYMAPAIFSDKKPIRENVKAVNVLWADFDGNAPDWNDTNHPSLIVQSSGSRNQHVYWRLAEPCTDVDIIESLTRGIAYTMNADPSGWDASQVLRPPTTKNYKRDGVDVSLLSYTNIIYSIDVFNDYAMAAGESSSDNWDLQALPSADSVLLSYAFTPDVVHLLAKSKDQVEDRSAALMNLAYACSQIGLSNNEIMVVLLLADDKWEKFKDRRDRTKQLSRIIDVARNKYPETDIDSDDLFTIDFGFQSFLDTEIEIDWVIEPMLMDNGNMLFVGPSGVGKTQMTLQFFISAALGRDFLHYKIADPKKILFLSLEMGHGELKVFLQLMASVLDASDRAILETNFILVPHGEPWALNTPEGQSHAVKLIEQHNPDIFGVDSIGSAIAGNISTDENVQPLTKFNDRIRKKYNLSTWYIHHMRKSKDGPITQDDVYGNQYLFNRATSVYGLLPGKDSTLKLRNFKNRLAPVEPDHILVRTEALSFTTPYEDVDNIGVVNNTGDEVAGNGLTL